MWWGLLPASCQDRSWHQMLEYIGSTCVGKWGRSQGAGTFRTEILLFIPQKDTEMHTQSACTHRCALTCRRQRPPREREGSPQGRKLMGKSPGTGTPEEHCERWGVLLWVRRPKMNECFVIRYRFIHGFHHRHLNLQYIALGWILPSKNVDASIKWNTWEFSEIASCNISSINQTHCEDNVLRK